MRESRGLFDSFNELFPFLTQNESFEGDRAQEVGLEMDDALGGENSLSLLSLRRAGVRFDDRVTSFADLIQQQQQGNEDDDLDDDGPSSTSTSLVSLCRDLLPPIWPRETGETITERVRTRVGSEREVSSGDELRQSFKRGGF